MTQDQIPFAAIEALLFASGEPVSLSRMAQALQVEEEVLAQWMPLFCDRYHSEDHGIAVVKLADSYQFCTKPAYAAPIKQLLEVRRKTPLSQAAMETLSIIAYHQPVTKSFIEQVRGVDSGQIVNNLAEKGLIEEAGRLDVPGRPITYQTTLHFLRSFQMESLRELPPLEDQDEQLSMDSLTGQAEQAQAQTE